MALCCARSQFFLVRLMGFAQFALPYFAIFGIDLLAMCDTKNADFEMQIGDFNRNLCQFWLVFRVILSIMANFVNISVENSSVEKYAVVRICTLAVGSGLPSTQVVGYHGAAIMQ